MLKGLAVLAAIALSGCVSTGDGDGDRWMGRHNWGAGAETGRIVGRWNSGSGWNGGGYHGGYQMGHQFRGSVMHPFDNRLYPRPRGKPCRAWSDAIGSWTWVC